jgi:NAD(P)-dependent dehydrogenase (short-subunit alcohol dehydrogenase family)
MARQKIAVVIGANRGNGLEVARQLGALGYRVILTARKKAAGREAAKKLVRVGLNVEFAHLDVTDANSAKDLARHLKKTEGRLDVLVNNAAI